MSSSSDVAGKLMSSGDAVARFVSDGAQVAVGGFTINRNPMAFVYEIARRRMSDLHLVAHSNGQALDTLVGAGCVSRLEIAYGGNGRFAPTCVRFRKAVERGEIAVEDYSNYQMALRFLAGALNVPFIPTKSGLHTDLVARQGFSRRVSRGQRPARQEAHRHARSLRRRRRRRRAAAGAQARRRHHPRAAGQQRRHGAHQGAHLRRPRAGQGGRAPSS